MKKLSERNQTGRGGHVPLRVAVIEPVGGHGGMDYYDFGLCGGLSKAGADVVLYTCDKTPPPKEASFGVERVYRDVFGHGNGLGRGLRFLWGTIMALRNARRAGAHLVHFHLFNTGPLEYLNILAARIFGFKVAITAHDIESFLSEGGHRSRARYLYRRAEIVIVHNEVSKKQLVDLIGTDHKVAVIPHGNYLSNYDSSLTKAVARTRLGLDHHAPIVLFFGQIKKVKGLNILINAWSKVVAQVPDARLVVAGRPWKMSPNEIIEQIRFCGVAESVVTRLEFIPSEDAMAYYAAADVIALPYRKIYQSGVLLMAMSLKTPVLASDIAGMAEVIEHGRNGMMFKDGSADDLAQKLVELLRDETLRRRLQAAAFSDMQENFDWARIGMGTAAILQKVTGQS